MAPPTEGAQGLSPKTEELGGGGRVTGSPKSFEKEARGDGWRIGKNKRRKVGGERKEQPDPLGGPRPKWG